jgi:DNA primase
MQRYILPDPRSATSEATARAVQQIYEVIAATDSEVLQKQLLAEIAPAIGALRIKPDAFERDFLRFMRNRSHRAPPMPPVAPTSKIVNVPPEQDLLLLCLHFEELGKPLAQELLHNEWLDSTNPAGRLLQRLLVEFEHDTWPGRDHLDELLADEQDRVLVAGLLFQKPDVDRPQQLIQFSLRRLEYRYLQQKMPEIEQRIASAEDPNSTENVRLTSEALKMRKRLWDLGRIDRDEYRAPPAADRT